jgi:hypothetical protein
MRTPFVAILFTLGTLASLVLSTAHARSLAQVSALQGDEFDSSSFTAPFTPHCGQFATPQPCPDPTGITTWNLDSQSAGQLRIWTQFGSLLGTAAQASNNARNFILQPVNSGADYIVTTKLTFPANTTSPTSLGQTAGLLVYQDDDNFIMLGREFTPSGQSRIDFIQESGGVQNPPTYVAEPTAPQTLYLRLQKTGGLYQALYSYDNITFVEITPVASGGSGYSPAYGSPQVGVFAWGGTNAAVASNTLAADFDWFRVTTAPVPTPTRSPTNTPVPSNTPAPVTPTPTAVPPRPTSTSRPTATPRPAPHLAIVDLRIYDNGRNSTTAYVGDRTGVYLHYRLTGTSVRGRTLAIFQLKSHRGIVLKAQRQALSRQDGSTSLQLGRPLKPGEETVFVWLYHGKLRAFGQRSFAVFAPLAFKLGKASRLAARIKVFAARVENNQQAQHEKGVLHLDRKSFEQEGRQTGFYESLSLVWPSIRKNNAVILDTLVSIFDSQGHARNAFNAQKSGYETLSKGCGSCDFTVRHESANAFVGDCCRAIYDSVFSDGYVISEIFFVRGQVLVQVWLGLQLPTSNRLISVASKAHVTAAARLDRTAWFQQQP